MRNDELTSDVERVARSAIFARLGYAEPRAIIAVTATDDGALLHVNSGGNALACEPRLRAAGYSLADGPLQRYGVAMLVTRPNPSAGDAR